MELSQVAERVQELSDIEIAVLLCLVRNEHCLFYAQDKLLDELGHELALVCSNTFGLVAASMDCSEHTTVAEFGATVVRNVGRTDEAPPASDAPDGKRRPTVLVAKNLNLATEHVQIQALELMRSGRVLTAAARENVQKHFFLIALLPSGSGRRMNEHLNDRFFISHLHLMDDGFPHLERKAATNSDGNDASSESSVIRTPFDAVSDSEQTVVRQQMFSQADIQDISRLCSEAHMSPEVRTYLHNIVVFLRRHRAVGGGVSARATTLFHQLVRALAPLHGLSYVSPSLVSLAARKIYPHRISITKPEDEWSLQWGSSLEAVREMLAELTVEDVIEEVLQTVEAPL